MLNLTLPTTGLTLVRDRSNQNDVSSRELQQIINLTLLENVTKDILKSLRNNEQAHFKTGKRPAVQYGKRTVQLNHGTTPYPSEICVGMLDGSKPMYFSGRSSHTLEVQKAREDTARSDGALAALKNSLKSMEEERASNEASLVENSSRGKRDQRPSSLLNKDRFLGGSTPSSPYLAAGRSPGLGPTSAPLLSPAANKEKIRLEAMRIPMIHLLAIRPMTLDAMAKTLNVSKDDCEKALDKVSRDGNGDKKELKEKSYRDLDVWRFPYQAPSDRQLAIDHAIHAYDRMRIEKHDPLWQLLLPKEERGKGKILSKLNFDKQLAAPKPPVDRDGKSDMSDREGKTKKGKALASKQVAPRKKLSDEAVAKPKATKAPAKPAARPSKQEGKFKSAERIEDSDEEAEVAPVINTKPKAAISKAMERNQERLSSALPASKTQVHKSKVSESSSTGSDLEKPRGSVDRAKLKRPGAPSSRTSPRPRTGSSPQKPSPLGSSPPTNSTDLDNSSKSSIQSSAPSSPPSSTDMPIAQHRTYSPIIAGGKGRQQPPNLKKRKADPTDEQSPAKKQQIRNDGLGALPRALANQASHPTPERRSSGSSLSSSDRLEVTKASVILAAKQFTTCYKRYEVLHEKLSGQSSSNRDEKDIDDLWKMHKRLREMKAEIWTDWARVSGEN